MSEVYDYDVNAPQRLICYSTIVRKSAYLTSGCRISEMILQQNTKLPCRPEELIIEVEGTTMTAMICLCKFGVDCSHYDERKKSHSHVIMAIVAEHVVQICGRML